MAVSPIYHHSRALLGNRALAEPPPLFVTPPFTRYDSHSRKFDIVYVSGPVIISMIPHYRTFVALIPKFKFFDILQVGPWGGRSLNVRSAWDACSQVASTPPGGGLTPP